MESTVGVFFLLWCRSAVSKDICHYYKIGEANYTISYSIMMKQVNDKVIKIVQVM